MFFCWIIKNLLYFGSFLKDSNVLYGMCFEYWYVVICNDFLGDKSLNFGFVYD